MASDGLRKQLNPKLYAERKKRKEKTWNRLKVCGEIGADMNLHRLTI
jgi:hypothetical protein